MEETTKKRRRRRNYNSDTPKKRGRPKKDVNIKLEEETIKEQELNVIRDWRYIMRTEFGSEYNFLGIGGCGTYVCLGPTESGKSFLVEQLLAYCTCGGVKRQNRIKFWDYILISTTAQNSHDFKKVPLGEKSWLIVPPSEATFSQVIKIRENEIIECAAKAGFRESEREEWAMNNPIVIICDDTYSKINMTQPYNQVASLATKARHLGIYLILCCQYLKQVGPLIKDNSRAIICLSSGYKDHRTIIFDYFGYIQHKDELDFVVSFNKEPNNIIVYYLNWKIRKNGKRVAARKIFAYNPIPDYITCGYQEEPNEDDDDSSDIGDEDSDLEEKMEIANKKISVPNF